MDPEPLDLLTLAQTDVSQPLSLDLLLQALSQPPFVSLPGSFNTRDLGRVPGSPVRPGLVYRSGGFLGGSSSATTSVLRDQLGIRTIFDLRSVGEHARQPDPAFDGIRTVWVEPGEEDAVVELDEFVEGGGEKGYAAMYMDVLRAYPGAIKAVLEHVRDLDGLDEGRGGGFMFHCTGELHTSLLQVPLAVKQ
jgi:hypothetical protein